MRIRYYVDRETGLPHIYEHDVVEEEVKRCSKSLARIAKGEKGHASLGANPLGTVS